MSDCKVNIRIFSWHIQLTLNWRIRIIYNDYHKDKKWPDGYCSIYEFNLLK